MKRILVVAFIFLSVTQIGTAQTTREIAGSASNAPYGTAQTQPGVICIFSEPSGSGCIVNDTAPGLISLYVFHTQAVDVAGVQFSAPQPACMVDAVYIGEMFAFPITIGNTLDGVSVSYGACLSGPIQVCTIHYFGTGGSLDDCPFQVLPHPDEDHIIVADCSMNELVGGGGTIFINSTLPCICGGEPPPDPILHVVPVSLDFGDTDVSNSVSISNLGGGTLAWNVSEAIAWLDATPVSGIDGGTVTVTVDRTGLAPGTYNGSIDVTSNGGNETIAVSMTVPNPEPTLWVYPHSLSFDPVETGKPLTISNVGTGDLDWDITSSADWLSADPASGTNDALVTVHVDRTGLADGSYSGGLLVSSNGGNVLVSVDMWVGYQPILSVSPTVLVFEPELLSTTFSIGNAGGGTLEWTLDADEPWIDIVPPLSGTDDATVTVDVDPAVVPPGDVQIGHITVDSNGGTETVEVRFVRAVVLPGVIGVYMDETGNNCNIYDNGGSLALHVVHTGTGGATGSQFAAPRPGCMTGAVWTGDDFAFDLTIGNSQSGMAVAYGTCLASPIRVVTINYYTTGESETCCQYPVLPHPAANSGEIEVVDCARNKLFADGAISWVNPDESCGCTVAVQEKTWGGIKALYR